MIRNDERSKAARAIGNYLLKDLPIRDQAYWDEHWQLIDQLPALNAVIGERLYFFRKTRSRNEAWLLIVATDLVWQSIRTLAGKTGKDRAWLNAFLPPDHRNHFPKGSSVSFVPLEEIIEDIYWVYGLNSRLRHPGSNSEHLKTMLRDPWSDFESDRLETAAEAAKRVLKVFESQLAVGNGFRSDIEQKAALALAARTRLHSP